MKKKSYCNLKNWSSSEFKVLLRCASIENHAEIIANDSLHRNHLNINKNKKNERISLGSVRKYGFQKSMKAVFNLLNLVKFNNQKSACRNKCVIIIIVSITPSGKRKATETAKLHSRHNWFIGKSQRTN